MTSKVKKAVMAIVLFAHVGGMTGCMTGSTTSAGGRPVRKKILTPDLQPENCNSTGFLGAGQSVNEAPGIQSPQLPFYMIDTTIAFDGNSLKYYILRVPGPEFDFLLPMAKTYEAYLNSLMAYWPMMDHDGLAIDLSAGKPTGQTRFELSGSGQEVTVPLVIMWDQASADRVTYITRFLETLSSIQCKSLR